jgi:hypothetical protein
MNELAQTDPKELQDHIGVACPECHGLKIARCFIRDESGQQFVWHGCFDCRTQWKCKSRKKETKPIAPPLLVFKGKTVIDEMCYCGHTRSQHNDLYAGIPGADGKGNCKECECARFTWKEFIYEKEKQS